MAAITPSGMPGTSICDGLALNGKGTSEPINTRGCHAVGAARSCSARNTIGGMPTPPPSNRQRGRAGSGVKGVPSIPSGQNNYEAMYYRHTGKIFTPYVTARVFGGPVYWRLDGADVTGTDLYKYQVGGGLSLIARTELS